MTLEEFVELVQERVHRQYPNIEPILPDMGATLFVWAFARWDARVIRTSSGAILRRIDMKRQTNAPDIEFVPCAEQVDYIANRIINWLNFGRL